jgi:hypothetical protein
VASGAFTGQPTGTPSFQGGKITRVEAWLESLGLWWGSFDQQLFLQRLAQRPALMQKVKTPVAVDPDDKLRAPPAPKAGPSSACAERPCCASLPEPGSPAGDHRDHPAADRHLRAAQADAPLADQHQRLSSLPACSATCSPACPAASPARRRPAGCANWRLRGRAVIRFAGLAFFNVALPRINLRISGILADILVIIGYIGWGFFRLNLAGVELSHLFATSAILTAVLAISMQDTLGNLLGGLALQMDNSLEIGDWIKIDDLSGQVTDIQWRFTALLTRNGEKVVVPNSQLMKGRYYVLCDKHQAQPGWRRSIGFNVDLAVPRARSSTWWKATSPKRALPTSPGNRHPIAY